LASKEISSPHAALEQTIARIRAGRLRGVAGRGGGVSAPVGAVQ
jgi:hypothetical protein